MLCSASWLRTSLVMYFWPHVSSPPATARTGTSTRPSVLTRRSNVLRRIAPPSDVVANRAGKEAEAEIPHNLLIDWPHGLDCGAYAGHRQILTRRPGVHRTDRTCRKDPP